MDSLILENLSHLVSTPPLLLAVSLVTSLAGLTLATRVALCAETGTVTFLQVGNILTDTFDGTDDLEGRCHQDARQGKAKDMIVSVLIVLYKLSLCPLLALPIPVSGVGGLKEDVLTSCPTTAGKSNLFPHP